MKPILETICTKSFVVGGINSGKFEYLAFDSNSGGYPYASGHIGTLTTDLLQAISWLDEAKSTYCGIPNPKVYEITLKEVDVSSFVDEESEIDSIISGLSETQIKMLKSKLK